MNIIKSVANKSGAYPPIIEDWRGALPDGWIALADDVDNSVMQSHAGFVKLTIANGFVTALSGDDAAYQAWLNASGIDALKNAQAAKLAEINAACDAEIEAGCDVTLSDGTKGHISLTPEDQINLTTAQAAIQSGAAGYPYHLDGQLCKIFSASDILIMARAATAHILYHTTYCNHLHGWVSRCVAVSDVSGIAYGCDLPADLAANMQTILSTIGGSNA